MNFAFDGRASVWPPVDDGELDFVSDMDLEEPSVLLDEERTKGKAGQPRNNDRKRLHCLGDEYRQSLINEGHRLGWRDNKKILAMSGWGTPFTIKTHETNCWNAFVSLHEGKVDDSSKSERVFAA